MRVLIIEDSLMSTEQLHQLLLLSFPAETMSFAYAETLTDGVEKATQADIILLDLLLPDSADPEQTIKTFAAIMEKIPTIVVTGLTESHIAITATLHGAKGCVFKPSVGAQLPETFANVAKLQPGGQDGC